jgi:hypothetical protein
MTISGRAPKFDHAQRWVLALTAAASVLVVLDALVVSTALTTIQADFGASVAQLEWTVNAYVLSFAVLLMTATVIGDRHGRRRMLVLGTELAVHHPRGDTLLYPANLLAKRWESRDTGFLRPIYDDVTVRLR